MDTVALLTKAYAARASEPADDATKAKLVAAAAKQVELFGIQRTTMEDVAKRAGVSRVTVYRHFPSRDDLIGAVLLREVQAFLAALGAHVDSYETDSERIVEGFVFTVTNLRGHAMVRRLVEGEPELLLPQLTTGAGPLIDFARELIVGWSTVRLEGIPEADLAIAAEVGIRLTLSLVLTPSSTLDLDDDEALRRMARRYLGPFLDPEVLRLVQGKRARPVKRR